MLRFISILSICVIAVFVLYRCNINDSTEDLSMTDRNFEDFVIDAIARNTPEDTRIFSVDFSLEDLFWSESYIYQNNQRQLLQRSSMQENFYAIIQWQKQTLSLQQTNEDIQAELNRQKQLHRTTTWDTVRSSRSWSTAWSGGTGISSSNCAGIIFDPCIILWEELSPSGIMKFWTEKWQIPL